MNRFSFTESTLGKAVRLGHLAESVIGANRVKSVIQIAEKISKTSLPKWSHHIPSPTKNLRFLRVLRGEKDFVYFPSCVSRQLGPPKPNSRLSNFDYRSLAETFIRIAQRANINLQIPENISGICCGIPFYSKGYAKAYQLAL